MDREKRKERQLQNAEDEPPKKSGEKCGLAERGQKEDAITYKPLSRSVFVTHSRDVLRVIATPITARIWSCFAVAGSQTISKSFRPLLTKITGGVLRTLDASCKC